MNNDFIATHFGKQKKGLSEDALLSLIGKATTIKQINSLRENAVSFLNTPRGREILETWQKKYWSLKNCSTCGHSL